MKKILACAVLCMIAMSSIIAPNHTTCLAEQMTPAIGGETLDECIGRLNGYELEEDEMAGETTIIISPENALEYYSSAGYSMVPYIVDNNAMTVASLSLIAPKNVKQIGHIIILTDTKRYIVVPKNGMWKITDKGVGFVIADDLWSMLEDMSVSDEVRMRFAEYAHEDKTSDKHTDITFTDEMRYLYAQMSHVYHTNFADDKGTTESNNLIQQLIKAQKGYNIYIYDR